MKRHYFVLLLMTLNCLQSNAQQPHFLQNAYQPPGHVGQQQAARSPYFQGYVQPVEFQVPEGATVAVADNETFQEHVTRVKAGLLVGQIYRFKIGNIPRKLGAELYPSVEVINRLYPPEGLKERFPIPVQVTQRDIEHALSGRMVVRVIYLEDPKRAYPEKDDPSEQRTIQALPEEDPLHLADSMGRPMAILRIGSRVPDTIAGDSSFYFNSPPVTLINMIEEFTTAKKSPVSNSIHFEDGTQQIVPASGTITKQETGPSLRKVKAPNLK